MSEKEKMKKALVLYAVEQGIMDVGGIELFDNMTKTLLQKHNCTLEDCYENPIFLKDILCDEDEDLRINVLNTIKHKLVDFIYQDEIALFIRTIGINFNFSNKT